MANKIGWCTHTWSPMVGCSPVSAGCDNCYAARMASRFRQEGEQFWGLTGEFFDECDESGYSKGPYNGTIDFHSERLEQPFHWKKPRRVFVCSMGDLFHESVTNEQIAAVMGVIAACPQHQFMVLTKRPERAMKWFQWGEENQNVICDKWMSIAVAKYFCEDWPLPNLWIGVSVENQPTSDIRVPLLLQIPAAHHYVSYEPGINRVEFKSSIGGTRWIGGQRGCDGKHHGNGSPNCQRELHHHHDDRCKKGIDLIICGSETGPHKRPMNLDWARSVRDQCKSAGVPFWFKKDSDGNETLDGVEHHPEFWK